MGAHADQPLARPPSKQTRTSLVQAQNWSGRMGWQTATESCRGETAATVQKKMESLIHPASWGFNRVCLHMLACSILEFSPAVIYFFGSFLTARSSFWYTGRGRTGRWCSDSSGGVGGDSTVPSAAETPAASHRERCKSLAADGLCPRKQWKTHKKF